MAFICHPSPIMVFRFDFLSYVFMLSLLQRLYNQMYSYIPNHH